MSISSAVNASIETGTSWTDCSFFVAVTTTSSTSWAFINTVKINKKHKVYYMPNPVDESFEVLRNYENI